MRATLAAMAAILAAAPAAAVTTVADDFESYAPGAFPSSAWLDAGALLPIPPVALLPSATVETASDAFGAPTRALAISDQLAPVSGIYQTVPVSQRYTLAADVRVDRFSTAPAGVSTDFPIQLTFARAVDSLYFAPQAGLYISSLTQTWHVYLILNDQLTQEDIDTGLPVVAGVWYRAAFEVETSGGAYRAAIADVALGNTLAEFSGIYASWLPGEGAYDVVGFIEGEGSIGGTLGNLAFIDNVNVVATPAPAALALFGLGMAAMLAARRRG